jgi:mRNA-degrading endonuclease toxin of MazEF toxin-antitoxin module
MTEILRGEIWLTDLSPVRGREQAGTRPCLASSAGIPTPYRLQIGVG